MTAKIIQNTAVIASDEVIITDTQSALDFIATVRYDTGCDAMIISKSAVCDEFFDLKTGIAGEVMQKFVNYQMRLAVVGDFSAYTSRALRDFIRESNEGSHIFFVATEQEAVLKLSGV